MGKASMILEKLYTILFALMVFVLVIASAFRSEYFELGRDIEMPAYQWDKPILVVGVFIIVVLLCRWIFKRYSLYFRYQWLLICAIGASLSLAFLLILQSRPYMDCGALLDLASAFNHGDYSALSTPDHNSYLYVYPFQIGFIAFEQLLFRLFGDGNYFAVQIFNVIGTFFMVGFLYDIAGSLAGTEHRQQVQSLTGILLILDFPLFIDVTFVYGDVLGWTCAAGAFMFLLRWGRAENTTEEREKKYLIPVPILLAIGYLLKTNILIFIIAAVIVLLLEGMHRKNLYPVLIAVVSVMATFCLMEVVQSYYANAAGIDRYPDGAPSTLWIAMGMLEDDNFENGWYNGYNFNTFSDSGYNRETADQMAKATIAGRLDDFRSSPRSAVKFYLRKFVSAWNDPQFDSQIKMEWGSRHIESLNEAAKWMIYGSGRTVLYWIMNLLHFIILAGTLLETVRAVVKKDRESRIASYILLPILGGMLFHLLWETQARYMIGYYSMMFPLAASGIMHLAFLRLNKAGVR